VFIQALIMSLILTSVIPESMMLESKIKMVMEKLIYYLKINFKIIQIFNEKKS